MGEKIGLLISLFIYSVFIIPFQLDIWTQNLQGNQFLKMTNEVQQLVTTEAGVTSKVKSTATELGKKGVKIEFFDSKGNPVTSTVNPGQAINIKYTYKYDRFIGSNKQVLETSNNVVVARR